jgi:hypothetical protein
MAWMRGNQHCAVRTCRQDATVSVMVLCMTAGGRKGRQQASSGAVRLCNVCAQQIAGGELPEALLHGIKGALKSVGVME